LDALGDLKDDGASAPGHLNDDDGEHRSNAGGDVDGNGDEVQ
jgi:hypothetical protein